MFVHSNEKKNYLFLCLFVDYPKKKKNYEDLKLTKLKFHITRNSSLVSLSTIEGKKKKKKKKEHYARVLYLQINRAW